MGQDWGSSEGLPGTSSLALPAGWVGEAQTLNWGAGVHGAQCNCRASGEKAKLGDPWPIPAQGRGELILKEADLKGTGILLPDVGRRVFKKQENLLAFDFFLNCAISYFQNILLF